MGCIPGFEQNADRCGQGSARRPSPPSTANRTAHRDLFGEGQFNTRHTVITMMRGSRAEDRQHARPAGHQASRVDGARCTRPVSAVVPDRPCLPGQGPTLVRRGFRARSVFPATGRPGAPGATIRNAQKVENLVALRGEIGQLVERMLAHGASSTQITHIITLLNDHTVCRVIELTLAEKGDPGVPFSWLCFGSEGRRDQTLHTDQDNGILFEARDAAHAAEIRGKLPPIAQQINQSLALCGFTLCKGNIMAGNPELCLSRAEWARRFAAFIREATPENLLGSSIYFDLRVVWGSEQGCEQLRRGILDQVGDNRLFQRMMAENALRNRPPVGRLREFVLTRKNGEKATLDLKIQGLTPFVDGARLLALAHGIEANNTLERFRQLVAKEVIEPLDGAAYEEAYHFIQQTRMQQHQLQTRENLPYSNRVDPDSLNHLDRRILRESLIRPRACRAA